MALPPRRPIQARRFVKAKADVAYTVLTTPADIVCWLSDEARCAPRVGGMYELRWNSGYAVHGIVKAAQPGALFTVSWQGTGEPAETEVSFTLTPSRAGTQIAVSHSGFGRGAKWAPTVAEARKGWARSLENLAHLIDTGLDLRYVRRPMLGVYLDEPLTPERIATEGLDVQAGIRLAGVVDGMSAQIAGLKAGDVIVSIAGKTTPDYAALVDALREHTAGESVDLAYVRGQQHLSASMALKQRPIPDVPLKPNALADALRQRYAKAQGILQTVLAGAGEEQAGRKPAPSEWSAKEALVHLCITERDLHYSLAQMLVGDEPAPSEGNTSTLPERLAAVLATAPTVHALHARLADAQTETLAMVMALRPQIVANRARYRRIGQTVLDYADHVGEHAEQIKAALAAA